MFDKIKKLIAEQLYIDAETIKEESNFINDLGADSLDIVQMLIEMEKVFGITFEDDEITSIKTVGEAVELIKTKTK